MGNCLIVNADDFGFTESFNYGVIHALNHGILSSASLMSNMDAATHAVALAKMNGLNLGQHTNIVQGRPCADPSTIPSIVKPDGTFYSSGAYLPDGFAKMTGGDLVADKEDVKLETIAQLNRHKALTGRYPVQLEGHSITQPSVLQAFIEVAEEYGLHCMRFDMQPQPGFRQACEFFQSVDDMTDITEAMKGYNENGLSADMLLTILEILKANSNEVNILRCHPGWVDATIMDTSTLVLPRCRDVQALCDKRVVEWVKANGIELLDFDDLKL